MDSHVSSFLCWVFLGMAWRLKLPDWMFEIFTVNFLEFLANVITHWITVPFMPPMSCYLNLLDSTNTVGWLHKSSFHPDMQHKHTALARKFAEVDMQHHFIGYSQHVCTSTGIDYLMCLLSCASDAQAKGVETLAYKKFDLNWSR
eukprot:3116851-Ditylum_brightwellii.AAC.1